MTIQSINRIHEALAPLASQGIRALAAAEAYGDALPLTLNSAAKMAPDVYAYCGGPAAGVQRGKIDDLSRIRTSRTAANKTLQQAIVAGRHYCGEAVDLLKRRYGRKWNTRWAGAGFAWGTLTVQNDPVPMLIDLRTYFLANPTHESEDVNVSANRCDAVKDAISAARTEVDGKKTATAAATKERDAAKRRLRKRLTSLRQELELVLSDDDERWYQFGFNRPADGRTPAAVETVTLEPGAPGEVHVRWEAARLAANYRVTRQVEGVDAEPVEVGLFVDRAAMVRELPSGKTVTIRVSARNGTGESAPAVATLVVP